MRIGARMGLRVRLVAGFSAAMLVVLTAAGAFVYWRVEFALDKGLDTDLDRASSVITPAVVSDGRVPAAAEATGVAWQLLAADGTVLDRGGGAGPAALVSTAVLTRSRRGTTTVDVGRLLPVSPHPYRLRVVPAGEAFLVLGVRRDHRDEALRELLLQLSLAGLAALAVTAVVGERLARAALMPVERYRRRAEDIAGGATGVRLDVPAGREDEVSRLGHTLNRMLAALERASEQERRFIDEASHELRTPLTLLSGRLQLARRRPREVAEHERILDELTLDVARLTDLAAQLLTLGAVSAPSDRADGVCDVRPLLTACGADLLTTLPAEPVVAAISAFSLERVLSNLVANARTHGEPPLTVDLAISPGWVLISVGDQGSGMTPELLETATGRFTRAVEARSRPGAGLGLSLVRTVVERAAGELRLCHSGRHTSYGVSAPVACTHDERMTVSILLPAATNLEAPDRPGNRGGDGVRDAEPGAGQALDRGRIPRSS